MKVLIELSPEQYDLLVAECDITSPEYSILKNAVVARDGANDHRMVNILCDQTEGLQILDAARRLYPAAAAPIAKALDHARES
ncbi:MAG TPA: hypothetical protein VGA27_06280 [Candidatus Binatia bacterium]